MIVHEPEIHKENEEVILSARVEFANPVPDVPERLWYRFPAEYAPYLTEGSEPFAAALVQTAMYWGESLEVRGRVSPKFAYGLQEYAGVFQVWQPKMFKPIEIDFLEIDPPERIPKTRAIAQAFSGGVDSFFTLQSHLPKNQPLEEFQVTHGLFIQGIDFELLETRAYASAYRRFQQLFEDLHLTLISAANNCRDFWRYRLSWEIMYGAPVISTALALGKLFRKFYSPSGYSYSITAPAGSTYVVDHLLSTDTLSIIHHGARFSRHEKMERIYDWELPQKCLSVCARTPRQMDGTNCTNCSKCLQIAARLEMFGVYAKFKTFRQPFTLAYYFPRMLRTSLGDYTFREVLRQAANSQRWDIYALFQFLRLFAWVNRKTRNIVRDLLSPETKYRLKKRLYANTPNRSA